MVGIPTRSVSCLTCRRRKKKCDKRTPTCIKCERASIECEGYTDGLVWVNRTVDNRPNPQLSLRQHHQSQRQQEQHHQQQLLQHKYGTSSQYEQQLVLDNDSSSPDSAGSAGSSGDSSPELPTRPEIALPLTLVRSAREQLYMGFFESTMLAAGTTKPSPAAMNFASMGWTKHIAPLFDSDPAVKFAALATGSAIIATMHNDKQLQVKGIQTYNNAVMEMAKGLQRTNWYKRDGLLVAARIMATFELLFISKDGPQPLAWKGHNQGQQAIFLGRGPAAFMTGPAHQFYADARINMVMLSIGQRKRSPFASPAWDKIPWQKHPKAVKDELIDMMQELPELLEHIDKFNASTNDGQRKALEARIMARCNEVRADLDVWAADRGDSLRRFDCFASIGPMQPPQNDAEFAFHHMTVIYWFLLGSLACIKGFFTSRQGQERIPVRPPGFYLKYTHGGGGLGPDSTPTSTTSAGSVEESSEGVSATEHYLWESAMYATKSVYAMPFFFTPDAGIAHSAAGLMSLAVMLRYYLHPASFCILGNEIEVLQGLYNIPIMGISIGQLLKRILGGFLPPLTANVDGPRLSHGLGWF